ncbi:DUF1488 domain-containing protein [Paraburkholderia sp. J12]|uniref:DUF1488 domain-containing protein n=1 Tax=Paraburkholderia sp. J12 TaxID=2805432 RepID=UPI002ABE994D|nr:DUF1488 domain-containing protein [Paraburkholderia sp. J12]
MNVQFIDDEARYDGANLVVRFGARVDGKPVACAITAEALEDHFGAHSSLEGALLDAFRAHRRRIESLCVQALGRSGATAVTLHSGFVRMIEQQEQHP